MFRPSLMTSLLLALCLSAAAPWADVYKVVDENGRVTYTDTPPANARAEKLELPESNSLPAVTGRPRAAAPTDQGEAMDYQLAIIFPPPEYHFTPGQRSLSVQVAVEPPLRRGHQLQISDNGVPVQGSTLQNIVVRGTHILQARILNADGQVLVESAPQTFYVHRPSVAN